MKLNTAHIERAVKELQETAPTLAQAIEQAAQDREQIIVVDKSRPLPEVIAAMRHERFHLAQNQLEGHLGQHEKEFLADSLAKKAAKELLKTGYFGNEVALEIGAHLAAGQYTAMKLTRDEAVQLWIHYITLLDQEHGQEKVDEVVKNLAPMMKEALRARTDRQTAATDRQESAGGLSRRAQEPGGTAQTGRGDVSARAGGERSPGERPSLARVDDPDWSNPAIRAGRRRIALPHVSGEPELHVIPAARGKLAIIEGDPVATTMLWDMTGATFGGLNFSATGVEQVKAALRAAISAGGFDGESERWSKRDLMAMMHAINSAFRPGEGLIYIDISGAGVEGLLRHEKAHSAQKALGTIVDGERLDLEHIDPEWLLNDPLAQKAAASLINDFGYEDEPYTLAAEIGAHLAEGPTGWKAMGITSPEAERLRRLYRRALLNRHQYGQVYRQTEFSPILKSFYDQSNPAHVGRSQADAPGETRQSGEPSGAPQTLEATSRERQGFGAFGRSEEVQSPRPGERSPGHAEGLRTAAKGSGEEGELGQGGTNHSGARLPDPRGSSRAAFRASRVVPEDPGASTTPDDGTKPRTVSPKLAKYDYSSLSDQVKTASSEDILTGYPMFAAALKAAERRKLIDPGTAELADLLSDQGPTGHKALRFLLQDAFEEATLKAASAGGGGRSTNGAPPPAGPPPPPPGPPASGSGAPQKPMSASRADLYNAGIAVRAAMDSLLKLFAPAAREGAHEAAMSLRYRAAQLARETAQAEAALEKTSKVLIGLPPAERWAFYNRAESGEAEPDRTLWHISLLFRRLLDGARQDVQNLGTGKLESFIENYLPHVYKDSTKAKEVFATYSAKAPMEGQKAFLKRRKFETLKDGMDHGLEPVSENPVDQVLLKLREMQKYIMAHRVLNDLKDQGIVQYVKSGDLRPQGFEWIDDKIATVFGPKVGAVGLSEEAKDAGVTPEDVKVYGMRIMGRYAAPEPAAKIINNYLSPGLRGNIIYRGYLAWANSMNQFQLGFSAFHLGFTSMDAAVSKFALGVYQASHGHPIRGLASAVQFPVAAFTGIVKGDKMLKEYYKPGSQGDQISMLVDAMLQAGGRAKMDSFYQTQITKNMLLSIRQMSPLKRAIGTVVGAAGGALLGGPVGAAVGGSLGLAGALRLPFAVAEQVTRPIMEWVVPRQKIAVFADLARFELERLKEGRISQEDLQAALARAWDSVDNRMGQLVYDNLFWNKMFKDLLMGSVRSVGWNTGTIREILGGIADIRNTIPSRETPTGGGKPNWTSPDVSTRLSYIIALPIVVGMIGALVNYLYTGEPPKDLLDLYAPRTGRYVNGRLERVWMPSYMKDIIGVAVQGPYKVARGKLHPLLTLIAEMLGNEDYWHRPIIHWDDPAPKIMQQLADEALKAYTPMAVRSSQQEKDRGSNLLQRIPAFIGVTPAPRYIDQQGAKPSRAFGPMGGNAFDSRFGKFGKF